MSNLSTKDEPSVQDNTAKKYQVKGDQCGEGSPSGKKKSSLSAPETGSSGNTFLKIPGAAHVEVGHKKPEREPSRSVGQRVKEAWGAEVSRSGNARSITAMSRTVKSRFLALTSRSARPNGDSLEEGLRTQKAGLRKIRHMMLSFNAVMITFVALTAWELASHALEQKRDPCQASSLIGHSLYYSIWYIFQLWHTNTARQNH